MAPAVMMPSMPRLSTPARSQISSPSVAKISGEAMRMAAAQKLAVKQDVERVHRTTSTAMPVARDSRSPTSMVSSEVATTTSAM